MENAENDKLLELASEEALTPSVDHAAEIWAQILVAQVEERLTRRRAKTYEHKNKLRRNADNQNNN